MLRDRLSLLVILAFVQAPAQAFTTGVDFLRFGIGARSTGMGESFVAMAAGVTDSLSNPASLSKLTKPELGVMHGDALLDASLEFAGYAYPLADGGVVSVSGLLYHITPIPMTLGDGTTIGEVSWIDAAVAVSYARDVTPSVSCGVTGKVILRNESDPIFGKSEGTAYAFDLGAIWQTPVKGLAAGASLLNTGTELKMSGEKKPDVLPQTVRLGCAYAQTVSESASLQVSGELHRVLGGEWQAGFGTELGFRGSVFVRTGYCRKEGNIEGITYGAGFRIRTFQVDYSNVPSSEMVGFTRSSKVSFSVLF